MRSRAISRTLSLLIAVLTILFTLPVLALPASAVSGDSWMLVNGVLVISNDFQMGDYSYLKQTPWFSYRNKITEVVLEEGTSKHYYSKCYNGH